MLLRIIVQRMFVSLMAFSVAINSVLAENELKKEDVLARVASCRKSLPNEYSLVFSLKTTLSNPGVPDKVDVSQVSVWSRGNLLRTDQFKSSSTQDKEHELRRSITCRNCERPGYAIRTASGRKGMLRIVEFQKLGPDFDAVDAWRIDWRGLGILPNDLYAYNTDPLTQRMDLLAKVSEHTIQAVDLNGLASVLITVPIRSSREGDPPVSLKCWFGRDIGMNPIRFVDDGALVQTTDITYQKLEKFNTWYPKTVHHVRTQRGKPIIDEMITVESVQFGEPIPDEIFQLAGLKLDDGQAIAFPEIKRNNDYPIWRNGKLDRSYTLEMRAVDALEFRDKELNLQSAVPDQPQPGVGRWVYFLGAFLFVALAGTLAYYARRK